MIDTYSINHFWLQQFCAERHTDTQTDKHTDRRR